MSDVTELIKNIAALLSVIAVTFGASSYVKQGEITEVKEQATQAVSREAEMLKVYSDALANMYQSCHAKD